MTSLFELTVAVLAVLLLAQGLARAEVAVEPDAPWQASVDWEDPPARPALVSPEENPNQSYAVEMLAVDGVAFMGGLGLTVLTDQPVVLGTYLLAGPIVHLRHGKPGRAVGSLAMRLAAPVAAAYVGFALDAASCQEGEWFCGLGGALLGGLVGMGAAVAIDAAVLAREPDDVSPRPRRPARPLLTPSLGLTKGGGLALGLGGVF